MMSSALYVKSSVHTRLCFRELSLPTRTVSPLSAAAITKFLLTPAHHMCTTRGALHHYFAFRTGFPALFLGKRANCATHIVIAAVPRVCAAFTSRANVRATLWARHHARCRCGRSTNEGRTSLFGTVNTEVGRSCCLCALEREGCTKGIRQEAEKGVHWELLLATFQRKKPFVVLGGFGHLDHALVADEMAAGPIETGGAFKSVAADDTFDADRVVSRPVNVIDAIHYLTPSRFFN